MYITFCLYTPTTYLGVEQLPILIQYNTQILHLVDLPYRGLWIWGEFYQILGNITSKRCKTNLICCVTIPRSCSVARVKVPRGNSGIAVAKVQGETLYSEACLLLACSWRFKVMYSRSCDPSRRWLLRCCCWHGPQSRPKVLFVYLVRAWMIA